MSACVIGVGHGGSGDDAVGLAVARRLREKGVEALEVSEPTALLELLDTNRPVIIVDAVVGADDPGAVVELSTTSIARARFVSTHGLDVASAVGLARVLFGKSDVTLVGVCIAPDAVRGSTLSPAIAGAVERAAAAVLARL